MANPWFRMYAEFSHDPKVQMLSEAMQRRYIMVMCLRCSNDLVTLHETEIAFHLRISDTEMAETKTLFIAKGFIDSDWNLLNWEKRQFVSDSSAERVKRHRAKRVEQGLPQQNSISPKLRLAVFERDKCACVYCGSGADLTIDHKLPQSRGGSDDIENLATACRACNAAKRDLTYDEFIDRKAGNVTVTPYIQITDTDKKQNIKPSVAAKPLDADFEAAWSAYPPRSGASKTDSLKAWKARVKAGESADEILAGTKRYAAYVEAKGTEDSYIKQPSTFFGPGNHFKSDWTVAEARASPVGYESAKDRSRRETIENLTGRGSNEQRYEIIDINETCARHLG